MRSHDKLRDGSSSRCAAAIFSPLLVWAARLSKAGLRSWRSVSLLHPETFKISSSTHRFCNTSSTEPILNSHSESSSWIPIPMKSTFWLTCTRPSCWIWWHPCYHHPLPLLKPLHPLPIMSYGSLKVLISLIIGKAEKAVSMKRITERAKKLNKALRKLLSLSHSKRKSGRKMLASAMGRPNEWFIKKVMEWLQNQTTHEVVCASGQADTYIIQRAKLSVI